MSENNKEVSVEPDILPLGTLFVWVAGLCASMIVVLVIVWQYFNTTTTRELLIKQQMWRDPLVAEAHAREQARLKGYDVVDAEKGLYRIPVRQAMDLLLDNPALLAPIPAPAPPAPPSTSQSTTAPTVPSAPTPPATTPATQPAATRPAAAQPGGRPLP